MKNFICKILIGLPVIFSVFSLADANTVVSGERSLKKTAPLSRSVSGKSSVRKKKTTSRLASGKKSSEKKSPASLTLLNKKSRTGNSSRREFSVGTVRKNHPLYQLGLRKRDVIKEINGEKVLSKKSFFALLRKSKPGKKIILSIERKGKKKTLYYTVRNERAFSKWIARSSFPKKNQVQRLRQLKKQPVKSKKKYLAQRKSLSSRHLASVKEKTASSHPSSGKKRVNTTRALEKTVSSKSSSEKKNPVLNPLSGHLKEPPSFTKLSKKEKKLLNKKSKYLQRAYVLQMNSKIYDQPHFDALHIYTVPAGGKVLISRKIFTPPSKFGTFYKIFIHKDKKVVGYISEIEIVPQFERDGQNKINPRYAILRTQLSSGRKIKTEKTGEKAQWPDVSGIKEQPAVTKKKGNRFVGLSLLAEWDKERNIRGFLAGIKFSGYGVLSSSLNMDMNIMSDRGLRNFYFDLQGIYDLIRGRGSSLYFGGGLEMNIERVSQKVVPGLIGSVGLRTVLHTGIFWQNELRVSYEFDISEEIADYSYGFLTSFQLRF